MSTPQDQYKQAVQQTQDAFQSAIDSWTKTVQQGFGSVPTAPTQVDPKQVVDQVFDFAEKLLEMQRDLTKNLLQSSQTLGESWSQAAGQATDQAADSTPETPGS
jgi:hypothetical protein